MALASEAAFTALAPASATKLASPSARRGALAASALCSPSASTPAAGRRARQKRAFQAAPALPGSFLGLPLRTGLPAASSSVCSRARPQPRASLSGLAEFNKVSGSADNTVDLCVLPMTSVPLPTSAISLNIFEPHLVALLQVIQHVAATSGDGLPARFGALPAGWVQHQMELAQDAGAPAASFMDAAAAAGHLQFPETEVTGSCCVVDTVIQELEGDAFFVQACTVRRFRPLRVLRRQPFLVVHGEWVDDREGEGKEPQQQQAGEGEGRSVAGLELEVWEELQEVEVLTARLSGEPRAAHDHSMLPAAVAKYAPHVHDGPQAAVTTAWSIPPSQLMAEVNTWRRMKPTPTRRQRSSVAAPEAVPALAPTAQSDPYWTTCEKVTKSARQEAFSFAAASVVETSPEERQKVLAMTATCDRLRWVLKAIQPYLASLKTQSAMRKALGDL